MSRRAWWFVFALVVELFIVAALVIDKKPDDDDEQYKLGPAIACERGRVPECQEVRVRP